MKMHKYPPGLEALLLKAGQTGKAGVYIGEDRQQLLKARKTAERYLQAVIREGRKVAGVLCEYAEGAVVSQANGYVYIQIPTLTERKEVIWEAAFDSDSVDTGAMDWDLDPEWKKLKEEEARNG